MTHSAPISRIGSLHGGDGRPSSGVAARVISRTGSLHGGDGGPSSGGGEGGEGGEGGAEELEKRGATRSAEILPQRSCAFSPSEETPHPPLLGGIAFGGPADEIPLCTENPHFGTVVGWDSALLLGRKPRRPLFACTPLIVCQPCHG